MFEEGVAPLQGLASDATLFEREPRAFLTVIGRELERFLDRALPVIAAAQSDPELRDALGAFMAEEDLGPHRGVAAVSGYLAARQAAGLLSAALDPDAVALMFVAACYLRASQRQMPIGEVSLPPFSDLVETFASLIEAPP